MTASFEHLGVAVAAFGALAGSAVWTVCILMISTSHLTLLGKGAAVAAALLAAVVVIAGGFGGGLLLDAPP